jgi:hypothetical protein
LLTSGSCICAKYFQLKKDKILSVPVWYVVLNETKTPSDPGNFLMANQNFPSLNPKILHKKNTEYYLLFSIQ